MSHRYRSSNPARGNDWPCVDCGKPYGNREHEGFTCEHRTRHEAESANRELVGALEGLVKAHTDAYGPNDEVLRHPSETARAIGAALTAARAALAKGRGE